MPPCGCCREFFRLLSPENERTEFLLAEQPLKTAALAELLPAPWQK
ncbi:MAG TPA: cytidine deaminase [Candidatus Borkfalkia excrementigallinarum]|uniref:Cytidine deaminase n=1 Tax=Candidatus Borkfalkia excrementigallinarum TaxID=2838506 RepID=A0A9D1ZUJ8_9FIRM|nr:cytidine deaminase [Candidatus Borkfalkia excrementigallinarum]